VSVLLLCIPLLLAFEIWQLVLSERYLGIRQIERDVDPRTLGLGEGTAFFWSAGILFTWAWSVALLFQSTSRPQALCMVAVTSIGYALRRGCSLKRVLVILTLEGALRVGMLLSLIGAAFQSS
jgi:hypothetical protein